MGRYEARREWVCGLDLRAFAQERNPKEIGERMDSRMSKILKNKKVKPVNPQITLAFNRGFSSGAKEQRKSDITHLVATLENLEQVPGIGTKTAWKVREYFLKRFGGDSNADSTNR